MEKKEVEVVYHLGAGGTEELVNKLRKYAGSSKAVLDALKDYYNKTEVDQFIANTENIFDNYLPEGVVDGRIGEAKVELDNKKEDKFTIGTGLEMTEDRQLNITLDTEVFKIVTELPSEGIANKIYLIRNPKEEDGPSLYNEYVYVDGEWELVGNEKLEIDLSPYVTKELLMEEMAKYSAQLVQEALDRLVWIGSYQDYTELETKSDSTIYIITDQINEDGYLTKDEAAAIYQPRGEYATKTQVQEIMDERTWLGTEEEYQGLYEKSDYITYYTQDEVGSAYVISKEIITADDVENMITERQWLGTQEEYNAIGNKSDLVTYYTNKTEGSEDVTESYVTEEQVQNIITARQWFGTEAQYQDLLEKSDLVTYYTQDTVNDEVLRQSYTTTEDVNNLITARQWVGTQEQYTLIGNRSDLVTYYTTDPQIEYNYTTQQDVENIIKSSQWVGTEDEYQALQDKSDMVTYYTKNDDIQGK